MSSDSPLFLRLPPPHEISDTSVPTVPEGASSSASPWPWPPPSRACHATTHIDRTPLGARQMAGWRERVRYATQREAYCGRRQPRCATGDKFTRARATPGGGAHRQRKHGHQRLGMVCRKTLLRLRVAVRVGRLDAFGGEHSQADCEVGDGAAKHEDRKDGCAAHRAESNGGRLWVRGRRWVARVHAVCMRCACGVHAVCMRCASGCASSGAAAHMCGTRCIGYSV